jgi:probable HAF family extracellular repeat protein
MRASITAAAVATVLAGVTFSGTPAADAASTAHYETVVLGTLGGQSSVPLALNDRGAVVGWSHTADGQLHPFLWRAGRMSGLGTLDDVDGGWGIAADINQHGTVAGQSRRGATTRAVRWENGRITDLGTLGGDYSFATAINDAGTIVGASTTADGSLHAFLWRAGRMSDLGVPGVGEVFAEDVNNRDQVVGWRAPGDDGPSAAYLWQHGTTTFLPGSPYGSQARAVNERGEIVGAVFLAEPSQAARWRQARLELIGHLPGGNAGGATAVNDLGVILGAGNVSPGSAEDHAFLWRHGVFRDLSTEGVPNNAGDLNNRGAIIGTVTNSAGDASIAALFLPGLP